MVSLIVCVIVGQLNHFSTAHGLRVPELNVNQGGKFSTGKNAVGASSLRVKSVCAETVDFQELVAMQNPQ